MEQQAQPEIDWSIIRQTIEAEKCLLILGPEVYVDAKNIPIEHRIAQHLSVHENPSIKKYYAEDGFFLFPSEQDKTSVYYALRQFYQNDQPDQEDLLQKIALIPFHFIFNLTPHQQLEHVFDDLNLRSKTDFYWKNRTATSTNKLPSKDAPLIYNMFGSIEERDSLILTHQDLFDYFHSILGARSMPEELKEVLTEIDNFIFLGVPFDRWYMQVLLRLLSKFNQRGDFLRYASGVEVSQDVASFCNEQFNIHFVSQKVTNFIDELYQEFDSAGTLRPIGEQAESPLDQLTGLIRKAKIKEAIDGLQQFLEERSRIPDEFHDEFAMLQSRFNRLNRRITSGVIKYQDAEVAMNQITQSLLELIGRLKNYE